MTLLVNLLLVLIIISYTVYMLVRFFKKSKQGKCSACEVNQHCTTEHLPKHLQ